MHFTRPANEPRKPLPKHSHNVLSAMASKPLKHLKKPVFSEFAAAYMAPLPVLNEAISGRVLQCVSHRAKAVTASAGQRAAAQTTPQLGNLEYRSTFLTRAALGSSAPADQRPQSIEVIYLDMYYSVAMQATVRWGCAWVISRPVAESRTGNEKLTAQARTVFSG